MTNKTLTTSPRQSIGNANKMTNYNLQCINCSGEIKVSLVAHRNKEKYITGFIAVCEECFKLLDESKQYIRMVVSNK